MNDLLALNLAALEARDRRVPAIAAPGGPSAPAGENPGTIEAAEAWLGSQCGDALPRTIFSVGMGSGYLLDALERRGANVEVVVLEPDPAAATRLLSRRDWRDWIASRRLTLLVGPDFAGASGGWRPDEVPATDPPVLTHPSTGDARPDEVNRTRDLACRMISEARANAEARRVHAARYLLQTLANAPRIAREGDASALAGLFHNVPAIVVAAGPSLDKQVQAIAAFRERALIICCDTASRTLLSAGVSPHVIIAHDPSEENVMHLGALPTPRSSWLVAEGSLHPAAFPLFDGRTFMFNVSDHHPWPWLGSLGIKRGRLAAWGSVATSALDLAIGMGCSPVVFAGLDLAFTAGRPYCRGTIFEAQWAAWMGAGESFQSICDRLVRRWPEITEPDVHGQPTRTASHLLAFRNWIRERVDRAPDVKFFNATDAGILHHPRIVQMPIERALSAAQTLGSAHVEATLRAAHRPSWDAAARLLAAADSLLSRRPTASPFSEWVQFAMGTIEVDLLQAALRSHEYHAWCLGQASVRTPTYH